VDCQLVELVTRGGGMGGRSGFGREASRSLRLRRRWLELATEAERLECIEPSKEARTGVERSSPERKAGMSGSSASEPVAESAWLLRERSKGAPALREAPPLLVAPSGWSRDLREFGVAARFGPALSRLEEEEKEARDERLESDPYLSCQAAWSGWRGSAA
jgi:hypothetical protein